MKYFPSAVPMTYDPYWFAAELRKVAETFEQGGDSLRLATSYAAPPKSVEGEVRIADGVTWNPGRGAGTYIYRGGMWQLVEAGFHENSRAMKFFLGE
jgi:hypothetical protein